LGGDASVDLRRVAAPDQSLQERPSRELRPGDNARLRNASATFQLSGGPAAVAPSAAAKPASEGTIPGPSGRQGLLELLLDPQRGFWVLLLLAAAFGAAHALTPGH